MQVFDNRGRVSHGALYIALPLIWAFAFLFFYPDSSGTRFMVGLEFDVGAATTITIFAVVVATLRQKQFTPTSVVFSDGVVIGRYPPKPRNSTASREWVIPFQNIISVKASWFNSGVEAGSEGGLDKSQPFPQKGLGGWMRLTQENARRLQEKWTAWKKDHVVRVEHRSIGETTTYYRGLSPERMYPTRQSDRSRSGDASKERPDSQDHTLR